MYSANENIKFSWHWGTQPWGTSEAELPSFSSAWHSLNSHLRRNDDYILSLLLI